MIVIEKRGSRNKLFIYFEFNNKFFFFQFENNNMYGFSSEAAFNEAINGTKSKYRVQAPEKGLPKIQLHQLKKNKRILW